VSCYICSEAGQNFKIHYEDNLAFPVQPDLWHLEKSVEFYVDGQWARGHINKRGMGDSVKGFLTSVDEVRLFRFQDILITDDDNIDPQQHQDLGCVEVRIRRTFPGRQPSYFKGSTHSMLAAPSIHERSKKLGAHCVGLGAAVSVDIQFATCEYYDQEPYVKFRFYYRKRDFLQAQGIIPIPSPAPPVRPPAKRIAVKREHESDDETDDDVEALEKRHAELKAQQERIVRKLSRKKAKVEVKEEQQPLLMRAFFSPGEVIDLT